VVAKDASEAAGRQRHLDRGQGTRWHRPVFVFTAGDWDEATMFDPAGSKPTNTGI
jgi:hypothetical protein